MTSNIKKLRDIAAKTAKQVTNEDKLFVRNLATKYGVDLPKDKPNCKSCYVDAAIAIYKAIKEEKEVLNAKKQAAKEEARNANKKPLKLMQGVDVIWRGIRINEASATPEKLAEWIDQGFPTIFCE